MLIYISCVFAGIVIGIVLGAWGGWVLLMAMIEDSDREHAEQYEAIKQAENARK